MPEQSRATDQTSGVEVTNEELRWRMEKVVQHACSTGLYLEDTANDFNKALAALGNEGSLET